MLSWRKSAAPRGLVRMAAPMSFGVSEVAPILPDFLQRNPEVSIDLHLSDALVDVIGEGFDLALRIGTLQDSSLLARRLATVPGMLVAAPAYLQRHGTPAYPADLAAHACFAYAYLRSRDTWHFANPASEQVTVRPAGRLRVNNGDAMLPAAIAGLGIAALPEFIARSALAAGTLQPVLWDWHGPETNLYLVTPPNGPRPVRVQALADFLTRRLSVSRLLPKRRDPESATSRLGHHPENAKDL